MHIGPRFTLFVIWLCLSSSFYMIVTATDSDGLIYNDESNGLSQCPSFCDADNYYHKAAPCPLKMFCCSLENEMLECCANSSFKVADSVTNDHNCYTNDVLAWLAAYWKIVLGVCLPIGVISVVATIALCSVQSTRQRRYRQAQAELSTIDRTRSNSAASSGSGSSTSSVRLAGPVVVAPEEGVTHPTDIHTITLQPPPYTSDKPPQYSDVFPG